MHTSPSLRPVLAAFVLIPVLLLAGCMPGDGDGPDEPSGPMYRCIGEAPYEGTWEEIIAGIKANPPACKDGKPVEYQPLSKAAGAGDSIRVHTFVMDSRCRFITEYRTALPATDLPFPISQAWDRRDGNGNLVPSGEYFVNVEVDSGDGVKDTTYQKMGLIMNPCEL